MSPIKRGRERIIKVRVSVPVLLLLTVAIFVMIRLRQMTFLALIVGGAWGFFLAQSMFAAPVRSFVTALLHVG
jgi:hypothetical protein